MVELVELVGDRTLRVSLVGPTRTGRKKAGARRRYRLAGWVSEGVR